MTAASGADRCQCTADDLHDRDCPTASGADQPTLRDQLAKAAFDGEPDSLSYEVIDRLLPLIEADRERAKAEALRGHGPRDCVPVVDANRVLAEERAALARAVALRGSAGGGQ